MLAMWTSTRRLVHHPSYFWEVDSTVSLSSHMVEPVQSALLRGLASRALPVCWRFVLFLDSSARMSGGVSVLPSPGLLKSHCTPLRRKGSSMVLSALKDVWKRMTKQKIGSRSLIGSSKRVWANSATCAPWARRLRGQIKRMSLRLIDGPPRLG